MKATAIGFVATPVTDVVRARKFYEGILGLKSLRRNDGRPMDRIRHRR